MVLSDSDFLTMFGRASNTQKERARDGVTATFAQTPECPEKHRTNFSTTSIVDNSVYLCVELNTGLVPENDRLQHEECANEHSRGKVAQMARYVILNEDELLFREDSQCPLCCQPYQ